MGKGVLFAVGRVGDRDRFEILAVFQRVVRGGGSAAFGQIQVPKRFELAEIIEIRNGRVVEPQRLQIFQTRQIGNQVIGLEYHPDLVAAVFVKAKLVDVEDRLSKAKNGGSK